EGIAGCPSHGSHLVLRCIVRIARVPIDDQVIVKRHIRAVSIALEDIVVLARARSWIKTAVYQRVVVKGLRSVNETAIRVGEVVLINRSARQWAVQIRADFAGTSLGVCVGVGTVNDVEIELNLITTVGDGAINPIKL